MLRIGFKSYLAIIILVVVHISKINKSPAMHWFSNWQVYICPMTATGQAILYQRGEGKVLSYGLETKEVKRKGKGDHMAQKPERGRASYGQGKSKYGYMLKDHKEEEEGCSNGLETREEKRSVVTWLSNKREEKGSHGLQTKESQGECDHMAFRPKRRKGSAVTQPRDQRGGWEEV